MQKALFPTHLNTHSNLGKVAPTCPASNSFPILLVVHSPQSKVVTVLRGLKFRYSGNALKIIPKKSTQLNESGDHVLQTV